MKKKTALILLPILLLIIISIYFYQKLFNSGFETYCENNNVNISKVLNCKSELETKCTNTGGEVKNHCGSPCDNNSNNSTVCIMVCEPYYTFCECGIGVWSHKNGCISF